MAEETSSGKKKIKLAIVEDDIAIVQMYRTKFELEGFDVETAGDGQAGLEMIAEFKPDVILLDLMMPNMNGLDALSALRRANNHTKIIVLTNMGDTETANKVFSLGADDFIVKADMTPKEVSEKIKSVMSEK